MRRIASETVGQQDILELLHQDRQDTVGERYTERKLSRTPEPEQTVCQTIRVKSGKYSDGCKGHGRYFQRHHKQWRNDFRIPAEEQGHDKEITGLRKYTDAEQEEDQRGHLCSTGGECHEEEDSQQQDYIV